MRIRIMLAGVLLGAGSVTAQFMGLPVGGGPAMPAPGAWRVSGGGVFHSDLQLLGGRVAHGLTKNWLVFVDGGMTDHRDAGLDNGWAFQAGAGYALPFDWPVDAALRATAGFLQADGAAGAEVSQRNLQGGLWVGRTYGAWTPYGFLGLDFLQTQVDDGTQGVSEDQADPVLVAGISVALNPAVALYAEAAFIEEPLLGVGLRGTFGPPVKTAARPSEARIPPAGESLSPAPQQMQPEPAQPRSKPRRKKKAGEGPPAAQVPPPAAALADPVPAPVPAPEAPPANEPVLP
jgi:hypothetical protein